jgi:hypothetical protein
MNTGEKVFEEHLCQKRVPPVDFCVTVFSGINSPTAPKPTRIKSMGAVF